MGRYVELARLTIETLHVHGQGPVVSQSISDQHSRHEINERNEESLSGTCGRDGLQWDTLTVVAWADGVVRLRSMPSPRTYPEHAWRQLTVDAERFLDGWAAQAHRLGWPGWELFGCHKGAPWGRIQGTGLVLLLRGDEIAALTATEAVIRTPMGAHQTYWRKSSDPLHPTERCLVWELGGG